LKKIFIYMSLMILAGCNLFDNCIKTQYSIDLGSSTTKHRIEKRNICKDQVIKSLYDNIDNDGIGNYLSKKYLDKVRFNVDQDDLNFTKKQLNKFKKNMIAYNVDQLNIMATAIYRRIANQDKFSDVFNQKHINFKILSPLDEAETTLKAFQTKYNPEQKNYILWNYGGKSSFITYLNNDIPEFQYFMETGSYDYERMTRNIGFYWRELQVQEKADKLKYIKKLVMRMESEFNSQPKLSFLKTIKESDAPTVYASGGLYHIAKLIGANDSNEYSIDEIEEFLFSQKIWNKLSEEILFEDHLISNISYLFSMMKFAGFEKIKVVKLDLSDI
jgi:hypothetical protein